MSFDWKSVVSSVAPFIGNMIAGPLGGSAMAALSTALLGKPNASQDEIAAAINVATPDQLLKLQQADQTYKLEMAKLGIDEQKIAADDRKSARDREMKLAETGNKDNTPKILAYATTVGFFVLLFIMALKPMDNSNAVLDVMVGSLGAAWLGIIGYYYGSSAGSLVKTKIMSQNMAANDDEIKKLKEELKKIKAA
jgi:hypothetical protein